MARFYLKAVAPAAVAIGILFGVPAHAEDLLKGKPEGEKQEFSYSIGFHFGQQFKQRFSRDKLDVDTSALLTAIRDVLEGKELAMTQEQMQASIQAHNKKLQAKQAMAAKENVAKGEAFMAEFAKQDGVTKTDSGIMYKVLTQGDGGKPTPQDRVVVNYEGKLIDGTVFDSSYKRGKPATFGVMQVIPGWQEVLQLMPAGSTYDVVIPPKLAYGERGSPGGIPPNATLQFKVELIKIEGSGNDTAKKDPAKKK